MAGLLPLSLQNGGDYEIEIIIYTRIYNYSANYINRIISILCS